MLICAAYTRYLNLILIWENYFPTFINFQITLEYLVEVILINEDVSYHFMSLKWNKRKRVIYLTILLFSLSLFLSRLFFLSNNQKLNLKRDSIDRFLIKICHRVSQFFFLISFNIVLKCGTQFVIIFGFFSYFPLFTKKRDIRYVLYFPQRWSCMVHIWRENDELLN